VSIAANDDQKKEYFGRLISEPLVAVSISFKGHD